MTDILSAFPVSVSQPAEAAAPLAALPTGAPFRPARAAASAAATTVTAYFNVTDYGAVGDGTTDDTAAINDTISAAESAGGGIVLFPAGAYLLSQSGLTLPNSVSIEGVGTNVTTTSPGNGSWLYITHTQPAITVTGDGSAIRRIGFYYPNQSPTAPVDYSWSILVHTSDVILEGYS